MAQKNFISRMYQVYELRDAIPEGIKKNQALLEREKEFLEIIDNSGKAEKFDFMTKDLREECKKLEGSIFVLKQREEQCKKLIEMYEKRDANSKVIDEAVSLLLEAIGAVAPPMEQDNTIKN